MHTFSTIFAATAFVLAAAAPALAQCGPAVQVGTLTSDPEKDTVGFLCEANAVTRTSSVTGTPRLEIVQVGARTREAERNTFGYAVIASAQ
jgi:hypothetical protein